MDVTKTSGGDSNIAAQIESLMAKLLNELAEIREKITKVEQRSKDSLKLAKINKYESMSLNAKMMS